MTPKFGQILSLCLRLNFGDHVPLFGSPLETPKNWRMIPTGPVVSGAASPYGSAAALGICPLTASECGSVRISLGFHQAKN